MQDKKKENELGFLSAILCIFVIFIHVSSQGIESLITSSVQYKVLFIFWRFCQFVVPGFIFLSALKISMKYKDRQFSFEEYLNFIKGRLLVIFLPYVIWVMVYYIAFCKAGYFTFDFFEYIRFVLVGDLAAQFYFIIIIMQFYFLFPIWLSFAKKINPLIGIGLSFVITYISVYYFCDFLNFISNGKINFLYNDRIFTSYFCFFIIGCYCGLNYEGFKKLLGDFKSLISIIFFVTLIINTKISYEQFLGIKEYYVFEFLHMLYCVFAIAFWFLLCWSITKLKNKLTKILDIINEGSYYTYLSHCLIIFILNLVLMRIGVNNIKVVFIIKVIIVYGVSIVSSFLYIKIKQNIKSKIANTKKILY